MKSNLASFVLVACLVVAPVSSQMGLPPGLALANQFQLWNLGIVPPATAIQFSPDGTTLYIAGAGNLPGSPLFSVPVVRDPATARILGFGPASFVATVPYIDAGLDIGPGGVIFFATFPTNMLGEIVNGTVYEFPLPAPLTSTGGIAFVPVNNPLAGHLLVSSFNQGPVYDVGLTPNPNGTYTPTTASLYAGLPTDLTEAIRFVPVGPYEGDLLVADFHAPNGVVRRVDIDPVTGYPVGGAATPAVTDLITNLPLQVGMSFDPVTADLFITDWSAFAMYQIRGFTTLRSLVADHTTISASAGGSVFFSLRAGITHAFSNFYLVASASGTVPGTQIGAVNLPLNLDAVTQVSYDLGDGPYFPNSIGFFSVYGDSNAMLLAPPGFIPAFTVGATLHFAYLTDYPMDFASNAFAVTIVP